MIENSVIRGEFNIDFNIASTSIRFPAIDIFPATLDSTVNLANDLMGTS